MSYMGSNCLQMLSADGKTSSQARKDKLNDCVDPENCLGSGFTQSFNLSYYFSGVGGLNRAAQPSCPHRGTPENGISVSSTKA